MKHGTLFSTAILGVALLSWTGFALNEDDRTQPPSFQDLKMHIEVDLPSAWGAHGQRLRRESWMQFPAEVVVESEASTALRDVRMCDATGRIVLDLTCPSAVNLAVTELMVECDGVTLAQALQEFPAGEYLVDATTMTGTPVMGRVQLSHEFPGLFAVVSPRPDDLISKKDVVIAWTRSQGAVQYVLEVEQDESGFSFEIALPPSQTSFSVPEAFLKPGESYEYSLAVEGDTDNELEIEGTFRTAPIHTQGL